MPHLNPAKKHILFYIKLFGENYTLYEIVWKTLWFRKATDDSKVQRMCFACFIPNATNTRLEFVILINFTAIIVKQTRLNISL